jgi:hypothetical protein
LLVLTIIDKAVDQSFIIVITQHAQLDRGAAAISHFSQPGPLLSIIAPPNT